MRMVTFTELRNQAKKYFDAVEQGETVEVYRHGKPVAILMPVRRQSLDRWKSSRPLRIPGTAFSAAILADRSHGR